MPRSAPRCRRAAGCGDELRPGRLPGALATVPVRATEAARARAELAERLRGRREEIEEAVRTRVFAIDDPGEVPDPAYVEGLRAAVGTAIEYGLEVAERGGHANAPVPVSLLGQARLASRNAVSLDTVLRRYMIGSSIFCDFLVDEASRDSAAAAAVLKSSLSNHAALLDRLVVAISEEYSREKARPDNPDGQRTARLVDRLLAGQIADPAPLGYELDASHIGAVAVGGDAAGALRELARRRGFRLLLVHRSTEEAWAWVGLHADPNRFYEEVRELRDCTLALGEPAAGLSGWRLTHRQALASLALGAPARGAIRYREIAVLASARQDDLLADSLRSMYVEPLRADPDGGETALSTLRAFFAADRSLTSAAAVLHVTRNAVAYRLRAIEQKIGRPLTECIVDLEIAVRLAELEKRSGKG